MNAIEIKGLTKSFGSNQAVKGLDMTVPEGATPGKVHVKTADGLMV